MKLSEWPSTHVNLITSWAAMIVSVVLSWVIVLADLKINEGVYYFVMGAVFAWAGVTAPGALIGKRATTKPEMQQVTVTEEGPPQKTTTVTKTGAIADAEDTKGAIEADEAGDDHRPPGPKK